MLWNKNLNVRPIRDWESLIGRAVTKGEKDENKRKKLTAQEIKQIMLKKKL